MSTLPISVLLLARDEAPHLRVLLPTLAFAREIVVVLDPLTRDDTRAVAEQAGARVFERALDGFGPQRRFALAQCTQPWVLWIDADERLDAAAGRAIRDAVAAPDAIAPAAWRLRRHGYFLGRRIRFCGWQGERVTRLFRRERGRFDDAPVHERLLVDGETRDLDGALDHHSYASWTDCTTKLVHYARRGAERERGRGRRAGALDLLLRPPGRFLRQYVAQLGFLDGAAGAAVCLLAATQVFLREAELWAGREPEHAPPRGPDAAP